MIQLSSRASAGRVGLARRRRRGTDVGFAPTYCRRGEALRHTAHSKPQHDYSANPDRSRRVPRYNFAEVSSTTDAAALRSVGRRAGDGHVRSPFPILAFHGFAPTFERVEDAVEVLSVLPKALGGFRMRNGDLLDVRREQAARMTAKHTKHNANGAAALRQFRRGGLRGFGMKLGAPGNRHLGLERDFDGRLLPDRLSRLLGDHRAPGDCGVVSVENRLVPGNPLAGLLAQLRISRDFFLEATNVTRGENAPCGLLALHGQRVSVEYSGVVKVYE